MTEPRKVWVAWADRYSDGSGDAEVIAVADSQDMAQAAAYRWVKEMSTQIERVTVEQREVLT